MNKETAIRTYLTERLNEAEREKTLHEAKAAECDRQISLYTALIETYDTNASASSEEPSESVENTIDDIHPADALEERETPPEREGRTCFTCLHKAKGGMEMPCNPCLKTKEHVSWKPEAKEEAVPEPKKTMPVFHIEKPKPFKKKPLGTRKAAAILKVLDEYDEPMRNKDIADIMGIDESILHGALEVMMKQGLIVKGAFDKKYRIKKEGIKYV